MVGLVSGYAAPAGRTGIRLEKDDGWRDDRTVAWRPLWGVYILAHEALSGNKKAGRIPMRDDEGPAKNLLR